MSRFIEDTPIVRSRYKRAVAAVILCLATVSMWADGRALVWMRLYRRAQSLSARITLMENATRTPTSDIIPMLMQALDELNASREQQRDTLERVRHNDLTALVVNTLGDLGVAEAAGPVADLAKNAEDPHVRGEAILTLGRIGAVDYADDVAIMLRNLNLNLDAHASDVAAEVLAWSCVLSLERMRSPVGFAPLFFASIGWYSPISGVREKAAEVMSEVVQDPTDVLRDLVRFESQPSVKLEALLAEERSSAPSAGMASVAKESLRQGLIHEPANVAEATMYGRLRLKSMEMLIEHGTPDSQVIDLLEEIYVSPAYDINERLTAILAIGAQRDEESVLTLVRFLKQQNERQFAGVTPADYRVIRTTIQVLGQTGSELAVEELLAVGISNWPNSIVREAESALAKIES